MGGGEQVLHDGEGWSWGDDPPRTDDALAGFHGSVSDGVRRNVVAFFDAVTAYFGEGTSEAMALAFLEKTNNLRACDQLHELGWREFIDDDNFTDWIDMTQRFHDCVRYGIEGIAPREYDASPREMRVRELHDDAVRLLASARPFLPDEAVWASQFAIARFAFDFGGPFTLRDLHLLAQIGYPAVRNAAAAGEITVSEDGTVDHDQGVRWLRRRRDFLPSRWRNPDDRQEPIVFKPREDSDVTQIPQCEDGLFLPETVVRRNRKSGGIHVTIGAKGEEESVADFFEALRKLAKMPTARWRRRNPAGNWGIVRARGAWVSVPTEQIRMQLAAIAAND